MVIFYLNISVQNYINFTVRIFLIDLDYLHSQQLLRIAGLTMGLLLKLLFLLRVMKDVILICLMTTLHQFMSMESVSTSTLDLFTCSGTQASFVDQQIF